MPGRRKTLSIGLTSGVIIILKDRIEQGRTMVGYLVVFALAFSVLWGALSISTDPLLARTPTVIACFHKRIGKFTGVAHPRQCLIKGYRGFGKHFVTIPIQGMKWGHWGANPTRGAFGRHVSTREGVRVIAYRRRLCNDGLYWYSRAVVNFRGSGRFFELRLPSCGDPLVVG
jgi:hypothetical protein